MEEGISQTKSLTTEEVSILTQLYKVANEINTDDKWEDINLYFEEMGIKYKFNPRKFYISTDGEILKIKKCYRCGGVANSIRGTKYDRFKESFGWSNRPICWSCYMKKYPYKAKKEIMKK